MIGYLKPNTQRKSHQRFPVKFSAVHWAKITAIISYLTFFNLPRPTAATADTATTTATA